MATFGGTIVENPTNLQGNSMADSGRSIRWNEHAQGSMANLGGTIVEKNTNLSGNSMASSNRQIQYNHHSQGNIMPGLGGSVVENATNLPGKSMASLVRPIQTTTNLPGNNMASLGRPIRYNGGQGNSMEGLGGSGVPPGNNMASFGPRIPYKDHVQIKDDHQRGGASVNTSGASTVLQSTGNLQVGSGDVTSVVVQDENLKMEYDPTIGKMVYVLDENETIDGLELYKPLNTMSTIEETGMVKEVCYGNQQGDVIDDKTQFGANNRSNPKIQSEVGKENIATGQSGANMKIENKPMQVQNTSLQNIADQYVMTGAMTREVDQSASIKPVGKPLEEPLQALNRKEGS